MSVDELQELPATWEEVRAWPPGRRLALATRILESLVEETETRSVQEGRREALKALAGIWKTDNPPTDDEVDRILEEERTKKGA